jgi:NADPH-dependent 2,4-dienoyl-CoA reductase/sulfur reductase-like enzyme
MRLECDYLACGYGLVPNTELPAALGCAIANGAVQVDEWQQTSQEHVFAVGETTGIGGLDLSLLEGQIAGHVASGQREAAGILLAARKSAGKFAKLLERSFSLRPELSNLPRPETIVCRCEDVNYQTLQEQPDWRSAKLHTRCGMGPCQGRVCGSATAHLFGWTQDSIRPPVTVGRVGSFV